MISPVKARYIICCFLLMVLLGCFSSSEPPADTILIESFNSQRSKFETLTTMLLSDADLQKIAKNYIRPEDSTISKQRLQEYRQLLKELDLHSIGRGREGIQLIAYVSESLPDDGEYKGYVHFPNGLPHRLKPFVIDNLDGLSWNPNEITEFYRKIDENWYLWFLA